MEITCPEHGGFLQAPRNHYRGSGCPKCISSRGENSIRLILQKMGCKFIEQKTFSGLKYIKKLKCDFFLPDINTVIEYNGLQHYEPVAAFGGMEALIETQKRDVVKYDYLYESGINLIIVRYDVNDIEKYLRLKLDAASNS